MTKLQFFVDGESLVGTAREISKTWDGPANSKNDEIELGARHIKVSGEL